MNRGVLTALRSTVVTASCLALSVSSVTGCGAYFWDVPTRQLNPRDADKVDGLQPTDPPETACARIARNAEYHETTHTAFGALLGAIGAAGVGTTVAMAAQSGHDPGYYASWASLTGLSAALAGAGIYLLTRGASDRQEYWAMNAAVAQSRADYELNPSSANYTTNRATLEEVVAVLQKEKIERQAILTEATDVETFADAQLKAAAGVKKGDAPDPEYLPEHPLAFSVSAHKAVVVATDRLADTAAKLALATSELTARQAAWMHCAAGLSGVASTDSAANTALAGLITTLAGSAPSAGGGSKSGSK